MGQSRIFAMRVADVYPLYLKKAEKKGRTKEEVDTVIRWLTGYDDDALKAQIDNGASFESFFAEAPQMNPNRRLIKGLICGIRVEDLEDGLMREIRYLDKLIDELAKGKALEKVLRS
jgi:hypothetical protein